jgi:hypothetical protein
MTEEEITMVIAAVRDTARAPAEPKKHAIDDTPHYQVQVPGNPRLTDR